MRNLIYQKVNIILADCEEDEILSFNRSLNDGFESFVIKSHIANGKRTGKISELFRYLKYFFVPLKYFFKRKKYNIIIGWQQFYALVFCFYCSIFKVKKKNKVVALNFTYKEKKGRFSKIYKAFMRTCLSTDYLDCLHVPSYEYADLISKEFDYPKNRIIVAPFGVNDMLCECEDLPVPDGMLKDGYALAIGRSNRDYSFLIKAWENINYPLVIISDTYSGEMSLNENIIILKNVVGVDSYPWIANCSPMIIPIDDEMVCSGDTVLLTAMSLKRKIIVTAPSALAGMYIKDKDNGLLVKKDKEEFEHLISDVVNTDKYKNLGDLARKSFVENYSRESMGKRISAKLSNLFK